MLAESHTVYLSDIFDDVNDAADGTAQSEPNFTPAEPLAKGTVYYWRVDEFDGDTTHKGDIWSFETAPLIEITDPNLVGWWKLDNEGFGAVVDSVIQLCSYTIKVRNKCQTCLYCARCYIASNLTINKKPV